MAYEYASVLDAPADVLEAIRNESVNSLRMAIRIAAVSDPDERAILMAGGEPGQTAEQDTPEQAPTSKRPRIGRPCKSVVFRTTSTNVARHIAERILSAADFKQYASQNWSDIGIATDLLKQIIARLEKQLSGE